MEKKEFFERKSAYMKQIDSWKHDIYEKRKEVGNLQREWCQELCAKYEQFKDKRVRIIFEYEDSRFRHESVIKRKEIDGYLIGFNFESECGDIYPTVAKVKKDGSASKNWYSKWDLMTWDKIANIESL